MSQQLRTSQQFQKAGLDSQEILDHNLDCFQLSRPPMLTFFFSLNYFFYSDGLGQKLLQSNLAIMNLVTANSPLITFN
jgi:hypothetical protein